MLPTRYKLKETTKTQQTDDIATLRVWLFWTRLCYLPSHLETLLSPSAVSGHLARMLQFRKTTQSSSVEGFVSQLLCCSFDGEPD